MPLFSSKASFELEKWKLYGSEPLQSRQFRLITHTLKRQIKQFGYQTVGALLSRQWKRKLVILSMLLFAGSVNAIDSMDLRVSILLFTFVLDKEIVRSLESLNFKPLEPSEFLMCFPIRRRTLWFKFECSDLRLRNSESEFEHSNSDS